MTITFSPGQFFHPYYGWFDKEPDLTNSLYRSGLVNEKIGPEHLITPDHPQYEVFQALTQAIIQHAPDSKMAQRLAEYDPATAVFEQTPEQPSDAVYEQRDLSYYLDGTTKFAGSYKFEYKDNTVAAEIYFNPLGTDPLDVVAHYEEHRANIIGLRKQGFHDDTINMLLKALEDAFVNARSGGLELQISNYDTKTSFDQVREITKALFQEYLRVRVSVDYMQSALNIAGSSLINKGILNAKANVITSDSRKIGQPQWMIDAIDQLDATAAAMGQTRAALSSQFPKLVLDPNMPPPSWDPSDTHIRDINRVIPDYSKNTAMSDIEKEARSLSIVFRVRGDQMIDYARRYEEIIGQLDSKLSKGEISADDYDLYRADLDTVFIKTHNLNIKGQAMAAGLSEEKSTELAIAFSEEYIKLRNQAASGDISADKIANTALQKLSSQGWPSFSLYSSENRATVSGNDPWYAMMAEDALYWQKKPQPFEFW